MCVWKSDEELLIFASLTFKIILFEKQHLSSIWHSVSSPVKTLWSSSKAIGCATSLREHQFFSALVSAAKENLSAGKTRAEKTRCSRWQLRVVFSTFFSRLVFRLVMKWRGHCSIGQSRCSMMLKRSIDWFLESYRAWSFFIRAFA